MKKNDDRLAARVICSKLAFGNFKYHEYLFAENTKNNTNYIVEGGCN